MATVINYPHGQHIVKLVEQLRRGKAIFSTNRGQFMAQRAEPPLTPIVLRSDPLEDVQSMVSRLRTKFPQESKAISAPINNIYEYFDHHDVHFHGTIFVHSVLSQLALENIERARRIEEFAHDWMNRNIDRFCGIDTNTQKLFEETDRAQHHESFLDDVLVCLKAYRMNPPTIAQAFAEQTSSATQPSGTTPALPSVSVDNRSSDYKSMVSASRYPSAPVSSRGNNAELFAGLRPTRERRNSARLSSQESQLPVIPELQYHSDGEAQAVIPPRLLIHQPNEPEIFQGQITPVMSLRTASGRNMQRVLSRHTEAAPTNARPGPTSVAAILPRPIDINSASTDTHRQFTTYQPRNSAGLQHARSANSSRISSPRLQTQNIVPGPLRVVSASDRVHVSQPFQAVPGVSGQFPIYSLEPLQQLAVLPPGLQTNQNLTQRGYPNRTPSFSQGVHTGPAPEMLGYNYHGYHFGSLVLSTARNDAASDPQSLSRPGSRVHSQQNSPQVPFVYAGNDQTRGQMQNQAGSRRNPHKSFSDDARAMAVGDGASRGDNFSEHHVARRVSSGMLYDHNRSQLHQQQTRGHRRNSNAYRGGSRRSSLSQHTSPDTDRYKLESGYSPIGFFGGGRGSGDYTNMASESVREDRSDGGQCGTSLQEIATDRFHTNASFAPMRVTPHVKIKNLPTSAHAQDFVPEPSHAPPAVHSAQVGSQLGPQSQQVTRASFATDDQDPDYAQSTRQTDSFRQQKTTYFPKSQLPVDPEKLYVAALELTREDVIRLFEPHGTIQGLVGPFKKLIGNNSASMRTFFFVAYSTAAEAAAALRYTHQTFLSSGDLLSVSYAFAKERNRPSTHARSSLPTNFKPSQVSWDAGDGDMEPIRKSSRNHDHSFRPAHSIKSGESNIRGQDPDIEGPSNDRPDSPARQSVQSQSRVKTPKKKKGSQNSQVTPLRVTLNHERNSDPHEQHNGGLGAAAKSPKMYRHNSGATKAPDSDKTVVATSMRAEQYTPPQKEQQERQNTQSNQLKETTWRNDISEPKPMFLGDIISSAFKKPESPKKPDRTTRFEQLTSDGSPSRKPRALPRKINTEPTPSLESRASGSKAGGRATEQTFKAEEWPSLRSNVPLSKGELTRRKEEIGAMAYSRVAARTPSPSLLEVVEQKIKDAASQEPDSTVNQQRINRAQRDSEAHLTADEPRRPSEKTVLFPLEAGIVTRKTTPTREIDEKPMASDREQERSARSMDPSAIADNKALPHVNPQRRSSPAFRNPDLDSWTSEHARESETEVLRLEIPQGITSVDAGHDAFSADEFVATNPTSGTQTERSEYWAELSERRNLTGNGRHGSLADHSWSAITTPDSRRSSVLSRAEVVEKLEKLQSPTEDALLVQSVALGNANYSSGNDHGVRTSGQELHVKRVRPKQQADSHNLRQDILEYDEARKPTEQIGLGSDPASTSISVRLTDTLVDSPNAAEDVPAQPAECTPEGALGKYSVVGTKQQKKYLPSKGNGIALTIDIPPRTPSPTGTDKTAAAQSKSPQSGKQKGRVEISMRSSSFSVSSGPISTHMKKKKVPTPIQKNFKKGAQDKRKSSKVGEAGSLKTTGIEIQVPTTIPREQLASNQATTRKYQALASPATSLLQDLNISQPFPFESATQPHEGSAQSEEVDIKPSEGRTKEPSESDQSSNIKLGLIANKNVAKKETGPNPSYPGLDTSNAVHKLEDSPERKERCITLEWLSRSEKGSTNPEYNPNINPRLFLADTEGSREEQKKTKSKKNKKKKNKGKAKSRRSSLSDTTVLLGSALQPPPFPATSFHSPGSSLDSTVSERDMFPPLSDLDASSEHTAAWLSGLAAQRPLFEREGNNFDRAEGLRLFDEGRASYQSAKGNYEAEKMRKAARLVANEGLAIDFSSDSDSKFPVDNFEGGKNPEPATPGSDATSDTDIMMPDAPGIGPEDPGVGATLSSLLQPVAINLQSHAPSGLQMSTVRARTPPSAGDLLVEGDDNLKDLTDEEENKLRDIISKRAGAIINRINSEPFSESGNPKPEAITEAGSSAELEGQRYFESLPLLELKASAELTRAANLLSQHPEVVLPQLTDQQRSAAEWVAQNAEVILALTSQASTLKEPDVPAPKLPSTHMIIEPSLKLKNSPSPKITFEAEVQPAAPAASLSTLSEQNVAKFVSLTSTRSSHDDSFKPVEPSTPVVVGPKPGAAAPSTMEAMRPLLPAIMAEADVPNLLPKGTLLTLSPPTQRPLSPDRPSTSASQLSEANLATIPVVATAEYQLQYRRRSSTVSMSEYSTTSSVRKKLWSEAAASPRISPARRGGQSFVGAPVGMGRIHENVGLLTGALDVERRGE